MAFIEQVTDEEATGRAREILETDRAATGFVQNHVRAFASRPDVYDAWVQLRGAIAGPMDKRRYELATVAAAAEIHSSYCCLVHGKILADQFVDADAVCALVGGTAETKLDDQEVAVVELARKVAQDASTVTQADIDRLRDGRSERRRDLRGDPGGGDALLLQQDPRRVRRAARLGAARSRPRAARHAHRRPRDRRRLMEAVVRAGGRR